MFRIGDKVKFIESGSIGTIGEIAHLLDYRNDRDEYTYRVQFSQSNYTWCKESELEEIKANASKIKVGDAVRCKRSNKIAVVLKELQAYGNPYYIVFIDGVKSARFEIDLEIIESGNSVQNLFSEYEIEKACADMDIWESTLIIQQLYTNRKSK